MSSILYTATLFQSPNGVQSPNSPNIQLSLYQGKFDIWLRLERLALHLPARLDAVLAADPDHPLPEAARIALGRHL